MTSKTGLDPEAICTLDGGGRAERLAWLRERIAPHFLRAERLGGAAGAGLALELEAAAGLAEALDHWSALERDCCSALDLARVASGSPRRLRVEIRGVDPDAPLFAALGWAPDRGRSRRARLARAAGAGAIASLLVCCALPVGAVALLGASAAPLAALDAPGPIAIGALLASAAVWGWLGRRRDATGGNCSGCG